jgi:hypothetical protein
MPLIGVVGQRRQVLEPQQLLERTDGVRGREATVPLLAEVEDDVEDADTHGSVGIPLLGVLVPVLGLGHPQKVELTLGMGE